MASHHLYQQTAATASQLGFYPKADDSAMASPRPSALASLHDDQQGFLQASPGSPYPPQRFAQKESYFDEDRGPHRLARRANEKAAGGSVFRRKKWLAPLLVLLALAAIAGAIAAVMASKHAKSQDSKVGQSNNNNNNGSTGSGTKPTGTNSSAPPAPVVTPLARYNWLDPNTVAYGVNIGNWLVLERWLDEDWFTSLCADCLDEWNLSAHLGPNAIPTLQAHYNSFIQESDIDTIKSMGMNMVRVTLGYWAVIDTPGEPFVNAGQLDQLRKLMEWCHARQIYITISMHGLPGSQSGDQSTGQFKGWDVGGSAWFTQHNQARSDQVIQALATWITQQQPYSSVIASVLPVNEPKQTGGDDDWQDILQAFYVRSYKTLSNIGMVMMIHPGYLDGQNPRPWGPFISANNMDPNLIVWETHPYPGYFPLQFSKEYITNTVCSYAHLDEGIQVPVFFGEWSTLSGIQDPAWTQEYWNTQLAAYSASAGSTFWNWKAMNSSNPDKALNSRNMTRYDFQFLMNQGIVTKPSAGQTIKQFVSSLSNNACANQRRKRSLHKRNGGRLSRLFG